MDIFRNRSRRSGEGLRATESPPRRQAASAPSAWQGERGDTAFSRVRPLPGAPVLEGGSGPQGASAPPTGPERHESVISNGSIWQGTLQTDGSIRVQGMASGVIQARDTVHIAAGARVDATIAAPIVVIAGSFQGRVDSAERVELLPTSRIAAEVATQMLNVHEGAVLDGSVVISGAPSGERSG